MFYSRASYMIKVVFLKTTILLFPGENFLLDTCHRDRPSQPPLGGGDEKTQSQVRS